MRGKGRYMQYVSKSTRITPAYAGKSFVFRLGGGGIRDHPRLCGEKKVSATALEKLLGSPPPMRGKEGEDYESKADDRITPAYAGKSDV